MKNNIFKKGLAFIIFFLIFGANFFPNVLSVSDEKQSILLDKNIILSDTPVFDRLITFFMKLGHAPSLSMCLIKNNSVKYKGYGYSNLLTRQKPTLDTAYLIGSISKTVTATALMQLYEQDLFDLDDDVNDFLDFEVRNPTYPDIPVTFRMLLAHQSSLGGSKSLPRFYLLYCYQRYKDGYPYPMIKELIVPNGSLFVNSVWNNFAPGSKSNYSSVNFILLEHLVEVLSKQKIYKLL